MKPGISQLQARGINPRTFVIGFDLKADEKEALQSIAAAGNGTYYDAKNYSELIESLDQFTRDVKVKAPPAPKAYLNPVKGGASIKEAVEIGSGSYTIWDVLGKGEYTWFKVASKKGQRVAVRATCQGKALFRNGDGNLEAANLRSGAVNVHFVKADRPTRNHSSLLMSEAALAGDWIRQHNLDTDGSGTYFKVGSQFSESSPNVKLEVMVQEAGDLWEGYEAPDSIKSDGVFDVPLNDTFYGHLGTSDKKDAFRIPLGDAPPASIKVSLKFSDVDQPCKYILDFYDGETKRRLHRLTKQVSETSTEIPTNGAKSVLMLISDGNANSILKQYMNSYELRIER